MKRAPKRIAEQKTKYITKSRPLGLPKDFGFEPVTPQKIRVVVRKIVEKFNPEKVILFGSYAYGNPTIDSDVLVVMESDERPAIRAAQVYKAVRGKTFPMDVLVRTPRELAQRLEIGDFFMKEIVEQGKVMYERVS